MKISSIVISYRSQRGVSTLAITMLLLVILSLVVLFSTSVGFFEQRTATNENRARIAEQAAEAAINLAGEALKANRDKVISNVTGGWLDDTTNNAGWRRCSSVTNVESALIGDFPHPCRSESDPARRAELWFYTTDGSGTSIATTRLIPDTAVGDVGGAASFPSRVDVQAVLCRIDTSLTTPACRAVPDRGNRIAITFIATARLTDDDDIDEDSTAVIKETWASFVDSSPAASVPVIGSGFVKGLGNAQIVTNPNAGGYGVPVSIWSPNDVGISGNATGCSLSNNGVGSFASCQVGEYLQNTPPSQLKTTCADVNNACFCPPISDSPNNFLSGHSASTKIEGIDILDIDGGKGALPDAAYFPGINCSGTPLDDDGDASDDSLFEFVFNASDVTERGSKFTNGSASSPALACTPIANCAVNHLVTNLGAIQAVDCSGLGPSSSGLYYISGSCDLPNGKIGSPTSPVIIVAEEDVKMNNTIIYGMLFVRSDDQSAEFRGSGQAKIFGSLVVEGQIDMTGSLEIIYDNTAVSTDPNELPKNARFARVPGSWLDATEGF